MALLERLRGRREEPSTPNRPLPLHPVEGFTAAATVIDQALDDKGQRERSQQRKRPLDWQRNAWRYYDELAEVRTYGRFMGDTQSRVRLFPAILSDDPQQPPSPAGQVDGIDPGDVAFAVDCLNRLRSPEGDRQEIQRIMGLNLGLVGEGWLIGSEDPEEATPENPTGEIWRARSVEELTVTTDGRWALKPWETAKTSELEFLDPETTTIIRMYRRHGRYTLWPDAPMRSANLICEELLLATQHIMGVLRSRIPSNVLLLPDSIEEDEDGDDDEDQRKDGSDPTLRKLTKHMSVPLADPRSAAAMVPFLIRLPTDALDKVKILELFKQIDPHEGERIEQLIRRLAIAVDMPPESLTGTAGLNHWSAWLVGEDAVRNHIEPYTQLYADPLTLHYLRPRLEAAGVPNPERWCVYWDARACIAHPDAKANAQDGYDRLVISDHAYLSALGFSTDDMPDEEEVARRVKLAQEMKTSGGAVDGATTEKAPPDSQQISTAALHLPPPRGPMPDAGLWLPQRTPRPAAEVESGAPAATALRPPVAVAASGARPVVHLGPALARIERGLLRDLLMACDAALRRALEKAQARIRSAAQRDAKARKAVAGLSLAQLAPTLGPDDVRRLGLNDDRLLEGAFAGLAALFAGLVGKAQSQALAEINRAGIDVEPDVLGDYLASSGQGVSEGWAVLEATLLGAAAGMLFSSTGTPAIPAAGEFDALLAATPGDIRQALAAAGGGPGEGPGAAGLLLGADFLKLVDATDGLQRAGYFWEVGAPTHPFEPHQDVGDVGFVSGPDDPTLAWDPGDFPYVSVLWPGDHEGCQCGLAPAVDAQAPAPAETEEVP